MGAMVHSFSAMNRGGETEVGGDLLKRHLFCIVVTYDLRNSR